MKIEKILLLSKGSVLDSSNNVLVSGHRLRMYKEIDELITSSSAVEGLRRGRGPRARWRASCVEEGTVEGHKHTRWRPHEEEEGGGVTEGERTATRGRRGRRCSTRKKTSGSICARRWRLYIREIYSWCQPPAGSKSPLLPVRITNWE